MLKAERLFNGVLIAGPMIIGAFLSGALYLAEGAAIPLTIFQMALVYCFFGFVLKTMVTQDLGIHGYGLEKWYLAFMGIIFFSIIYSPEREQALFYAIRQIVLFGVTYLVFNLVDSRRQFKYICYGIIGVSLVIGVVNIIQTYLNPEAVAFNYLNQGRRLMRTEGTEVDPNVFASNFIIPIMLLVSFFNYVETKKAKLGIFMLAALLLAPVLLTYSRSAWVSIFTGIMLIMIYRRKFDFLIYGIIAFAFVFAGSETLQNLVFTLFERVADIFAGTEDDSSKFRIILAVTSVLMYLDTYMLGVGYQGFSSAFQEYHPPQETIGIYEPHNDFYMVYAELGLVGFIIFLIILWQIFQRSRLNVRLFEKKDPFRSVALAFFASFISYMIFCQFISGLFLNSIFMVSVGLIFVLPKLARSLKNSDENSPEIQEA